MSSSEVVIEEVTKCTLSASAEGPPTSLDEDNLIDPSKSVNIKVLDVHLLKLNRLLDNSMKKSRGNIVLQAYIVKGILLNNQESEYHVLILNESTAFAIYKFLHYIERSTLNETNLIFAYSLKMPIEEMWEIDDKWELIDVNPFLQKRLEFKIATLVTADKRLVI